MMRTSVISRSVRRVARLSLHACGVLAICTLFRMAPANADVTGPDTAMMAPVTQLVHYMGHVDGASLPPVFVERGLVIVENFAPYVFRGSDAAARWDAGFRQHVAEGGLRDLTTEFGDPQDFDQVGSRVYFSLPTIWRGIDSGKRFEEFGSWVFVLERTAGSWRILSYAWGVSRFSEGATVP